MYKNPDSSFLLVFPLFIFYVFLSSFLFGLALKTVEEKTKDYCPNTCVKIKVKYVVLPRVTYKKKISRKITKVKDMAARCTEHSVFMQGPNIDSLP